MTYLVIWFVQILQKICFDLINMNLKQRHKFWIYKFQQRFDISDYGVMWIAFFKGLIIEANHSMKFELDLEDYTIILNMAPSLL